MTTKTTGLVMPTGVSTKKATPPPKQPRQVHGTVVMVCHCGTHYKTTLPKLQRGHGLACSGTCAIARRTRGKPAATRLDGQPLPITGLSVNRPRKELKPTPVHGVTLQTSTLTVPATFTHLKPTLVDYAQLHTVRRFQAVFTVHGVAEGKQVKLMQVTLHGARGKLKVYSGTLHTYTAQLRAQTTLTQATRELLAMAYPTVALSKADIDLQAIVGSLADQGVFYGYMWLSLAVASSQIN